MIIVLAVAALVPVLLILTWLVDFARASRNDALFTPASSAQNRRARRLTGMYVRGSGPAPDDRTDDDRLISH
ncbi:hypothetical protein [Actinomadura flavalba]|uniref:hypothetical protein n=1 Tax=Actinomadura flavalba TaxID=1120938 RepID=UPI000364B639|nr:hypothetical protein [Actinomadura flavalba]